MKRMLPKAKTSIRKEYDKIFANIPETRSSLSQRDFEHLCEISGFKKRDENVPENIQKLKPKVEKIISFVSVVEKEASRLNYRDQLLHPNPRVKAIHPLKNE
eukprot:maker-scaffold_12-snap-gene-3.17-mRNA-1 protein AED:0.00 eAED:0.00 QI:39/1/1/1/1/1/2/92/101